MNIKRTMIHAFFMDKNFFSTPDEAKNFLLANGYKAEGIEEDEFMFVAPQREAADFKLEAFDTKEQFVMVWVGPGVMAAVGELNEGAKSKTEVDFTKSYSFQKVDEAKQIVTGPVLVPLTVDLQGDFELPEDIEMTAHKFMEDARKIGEMHRKFGNIGIPVESWILREPIFTKQGRFYPTGTWMMSVKVTDEKVWRKVLNGELNGFSIGFRGTREAVA